MATEYKFNPIYEVKSLGSGYAAPIGGVEYGHAVELQLIPVELQENPNTPSEETMPDKPVQLCVTEDVLHALRLGKKYLITFQEVQDGRIK